MKVVDTIGAAAGAASSTPLLRGALLVALLAVLLAASVPVARAVAPHHVSFPVDVSYPIEELSPVCGFDVTFSLTGTFAGVIFHDRSDDIAREFNMQPGTKITLSSPTTGRSFTYPFSTVFHVTYPDGVEPGDPVIVSATGFFEKIPGISPTAGNMLLTGGTVLFVENGVPIADYGVPTSFRGRSNEDGVVDAAVCAALAP
jgi:hypothetical protein